MAAKNAMALWGFQIVPGVLNQYVCLNWRSRVLLLPSDFFHQDKLTMVWGGEFKILAPRVCKFSTWMLQQSLLYT
jgi:hypothetical protein